jgi:hypothetical protein
LAAAVADISLVLPGQPAVFVMMVKPVCILTDTVIRKAGRQRRVLRPVRNPVARRVGQEVFGGVCGSEMHLTQSSGGIVPVVMLLKGTADADQLSAVTPVVFPVQCRQVQRVALQLPGWCVVCS